MLFCPPKDTALNELKDFINDKMPAYGEQTLRLPLRVDIEELKPDSWERGDKEHLHYTKLLNA